MSAIRDLAARLERLEYAERARNKPQLHASSIEDGAITEYDRDGNLTATIGRQYDGTHGITVQTGPIPPTATRPILTPGRNQLTARWDGIFMGTNGAPDILVVAPMDFSRVEVHASTAAPDFEPTSETLVGTIETPRGGDVVITPCPGGPWYVRFLTRSLAGKASPASFAAAATPLTEGSIVLDRIDAAETAIVNAGDIMLGPDELPLGEKLELTDQEVNGLSGRLDNEIVPAINAAAASPVTDARLAEGSLTVWPFAPNTIPAGTIGSTELEDFSILVTKLRTDRHHLY
jgi:hypothetical protein